MATMSYISQDFQFVGSEDKSMTLVTGSPYQSLELETPKVSRFPGVTYIKDEHEVIYFSSDRTLTISVPSVINKLYIQGSSGLNNRAFLYKYSVTPGEVNTLPIPEGCIFDELEIGQNIHLSIFPDTYTSSSHVFTVNSEEHGLISEADHHQYYDGYLTTFYIPVRYLSDELQLNYIYINSTPK